MTSVDGEAPATRCVVCGAACASEHYASTWERTRRRYPCCSPACAQRFDPDVHWIPARFPGPADDEEVGRLLGVGRRRLADGDRPLLVTRELLLAGLPPGRVRGLIIELGGRADRERQAARRGAVAAALVSVLSLLVGLLVFWRARSSSASRLAAPGEADAAYAAIEAWCQAIGAPAGEPPAGDPRVTGDAPGLPRATARRRDG